MRSKFLVAMSVCVLLAAAAGVSAAEKDKDTDTPKSEIGESLKFEIYSRPYFVKNTFEPDKAESFAVLTSFDQFNDRFGVGMVMHGPRPTIDADTFKSRVLLVAVKRGPLCRYKVESVTAKGGDLAVRYEAKVDPPGTAQFAVPLIIAVPKGKYPAVTFIENGKEVKVVK